MHNIVLETFFNLVFYSGDVLNTGFDIASPASLVKFLINIFGANDIPMQSRVTTLPISTVCTCQPHLPITTDSVILYFY